MTDEEAFHAFISRIQPHPQEHVGAHVQGDMEAAIAMAQRLEVYGVETGSRRLAKDPKSLKTRKREMWRRSRGARWRDRPGGPSHEETTAKEGQGRLGFRWKEAKEGRTKESPVPQLWLRPLLAGLQGGKKSKRNFVLPREKISPAPFAHTDGSRGGNPWIDSRRQRGKRPGNVAAKRR